MKDDALKTRFAALGRKLWFRIFLNVGLIILSFVAVLTAANGTLLVRYYTARQRAALIGQMHRLEKIDHTDDALAELMSEISTKYYFEAEIFDESGRIVYTTSGNQMMHYFTRGDKMTMMHEELEILRTETLDDGTLLQTAERRFDRQKYLVCQKQMSDGLSAELRIQMRLIRSSAQTANRFITIIAVICLFLSLLWVYRFARRFSRPIANMSEITRDMAQLRFDRRLTVDRTDEIGQLAESVNELSDSLSSALTDLQATNARLRDEIELERQLDVMRRGFVANVSHELKTPISIISGYAEGLKMNVNADSREEYCNVIIDESQRMNRLVLSILELSRYESGEIPLSRQDFRIDTLAADCARRIFANAAVTVENRLPDGLTVNGDPMQIEQVLKSYLENARSHTPAGGTVTLTAAVQEYTVRIGVCNTGSHVDEEQMPQIWQSFFRGDASHRRDNSRFGLGLSIVSAIMKLHGTDCGVYNTEDGVCFWFDVKKAEE